MLEQSGTKLELEAVSGLRPSYMTDVYLRGKIEQSLWKQSSSLVEEDFSLSDEEENDPGREKDLSSSTDKRMEDNDRSRDFIDPNMDKHFDNEKVVSLLVREIYE